MYPRKATFTVLPAKHNLRNVIEGKNGTNLLLKYTTLRKFLFGNALQDLTTIKTEILNFIQKENLINIFRKKLLSVPTNLKNQSAVIIRTWTHQCECVVAQKLRRGQQMFCLYTRLWEERALKEFLRGMKQQVTRRGRELMMSAMGISAYNWEANRIPDKEIIKHVNELEYMRVLKSNTLICSECKKSDKKSKNIDSRCDCSKKSTLYVPYDNWTVFIEKEDMVIWRKAHEGGSYEYKVYGSFDDVYAEDFLNVQIDIEYRKTWDTTAVQLDIVDKDPNPEMNSDILYWEMLWPKFFTNRDYVFKRRYMLDLHTKTLLLVSKCTEHPSRPPTPDKHRISDYWSYMVIRPYSSYNSLGLEFGLTYFDNPGVNVPTAVTNWVAYRAMPEFLNKLRVAARAYQDYCNKHKCLRHVNLEKFIESELQKEKDSKKPKSLEAAHDQSGTPKEAGSTERNSGLEIMTSPSPMMQADLSKHSYWKYLQPTYYLS